MGEEKESSMEAAQLNKIISVPNQRRKQDKMLPLAKKFSCARLLKEFWIKVFNNNEKYKQGLMQT